VDDEVEAGEHRLTDLGGVLEPGPGEGGHQDAGDPLAHRLGVPVERDVDEAAPVAPERVPPGEQADPVPFLEGEDPERRVVQLGRGDLEQLEARQCFDDLGQRLGVVGGRGEAGPLLDLGHRPPQDGNLDGRGLVHRRRVEPEEASLPDDAAVGVVALDPDVVERRRAVDGGAGRRLGEDEGHGRRRRPAQLGRDAGEAAGGAGRAGVRVRPEDAEPAGRIGPQRAAVLVADEVVVPVAEEDVVVVGHETEEVAGLGTVFSGDTPEPPGSGLLARRQVFLELGGQVEGVGAHGRPVLHGGTDVFEDGEEIGLQALHPLAGWLPVDLDVDERLGDPCTDTGESAVAVAGHGDDGMNDQVQPAALTDERHGDRVEQEGHVVDDDLDDRVGGGPTVVVKDRRVDPDAGGARRPPLGQMQVGEGRAGQVDGIAPDEVFGGDPFPIGPQQGLGRLGRGALAP
jgi:hypothetical protein